MSKPRTSQKPAASLRPRVPPPAAVEAESAPAGETGGRLPRRAHTIWREYFESGVVTLIMALFFMTFVAQAAAVPSASMENTILVGDHFLINKFIFAPGSSATFLPQRDIRRGDIIVFKFPGETQHRSSGERPEVEQYKTFFIKRVIGLPGETIEARGANVLINGQILPERRVTAGAGEAVPPNDSSSPDASPAPVNPSVEPYTVYYSPSTLNPPRGIVENVPPGFRYAVGGRPFVIPPDSYFVMGDNRDNSADSRVWGVVPRDLVVGRAMFVIWSYDESAPSSGNFITNFFKNTRWRRTGTLIK